jgi:hypothetical protein
MDAIVVDVSVIAKGDGPLAGRALAVPHEEAAVDARAEQVLGRGARDGSVVPGELVKAVHGSHVVARYPALHSSGTRHTRPLTRVIVLLYPHFLPCTYPHTHTT